MGSSQPRQEGGARFSGQDLRPQVSAWASPPGTQRKQGGETRPVKTGRAAVLQGSVLGGHGAWFPSASLLAAVPTRLMEVSLSVAWVTFHTAGPACLLWLRRRLGPLRTWWG